MEIIPSGFILLLLVALTFRWGLAGGLIGYGIVAPFGTAAALFITAAGGLSLMVSDLATVVIIGIWLARQLLVQREPCLPKPDPFVQLWLALTVYTVFTALFYPRIFAGETLVIGLNPSAGGQPVHPWLSTFLIPLQPTGTNISQTLYFVLSALFLYVAAALAQNQGPSVLERVVIASSTVNFGLGLANLIGLDPLVDWFRTADYTIFLQATITGFRRLIGGFSEASAFGSFSALLFAYTTSRYLDTGKRHWAALATTNGFLAAAALSSSTIAGLAVAVTWLSVRSAIDILSGNAPRVTAARIFILFGGAMGVAASLVAFTPAGEALDKILGVLVLNKFESLSGIERSIWAREGLRVGLDTFGLGAGLGAMRSNGWFAVWFSNLGVVGLAVLLLFIARLFVPLRRMSRDINAWMMSRAAQASLAVALTTKFSGATKADPGTFFMLMAAIVLTSTVVPTRPSGNSDS